MTSNAFNQAAFAPETEEVFIALLTFTSDQLESPLYITSDPMVDLPIAGVRGVISNGQEYVYVPFEIYLPRDDKSGTVSAKLQMENIDRLIVGTLRSITQPVVVQIQIVLSGNVDFVEMNFDNFRLTNIFYDVMKVGGDLTLDYWGLEPFPAGRFTPSGFPGLF